MAKAKTAFVCAECGADHNKWQGQCAGCGAWNTLSEIVVEPAAASRSPARSGYAGAVASAQVTALKDVGSLEESRVSTGLSELDRVLGGGLVEGSVVLVELSTGEETWDNIVAMWKPAQLPANPTEPLPFEYRLAWLEEQLPGLLCKVTHTRRGFVNDYVYIPASAASPDAEIRLSGFDVGDPHEWITWSDHLPLIVDLEIRGSW